ncbi:hypothetical protein KI387_005979, partial [Taxus chinensis]
VLFCQLRAVVRWCDFRVLCLCCAVFWVWALCVGWVGGGWWRILVGVVAALA